MNVAFSSPIASCCCCGLLVLTFAAIQPSISWRAINHLCTHLTLVFAEFDITVLPETPHNSHHPMAQISSKIMKQGKYSICRRTIGRDFMRNGLPKTSQASNLHNKRTREKKTWERSSIGWSQVTTNTSRVLNFFILQSDSCSQETVTYSPN